MRADDLRHRPRPVPVPGGGSRESGDVFASVAADVPPEYRDAYLEGFARVRADHDDTAA